MIGKVLIYDKGEHIWTLCTVWLMHQHGSKFFLYPSKIPQIIAARLVPNKTVIKVLSSLNRVALVLFIQQ